MLFCFLFGQLCLGSALAAEKLKLLFFLRWKFSHQERFSQQSSGCTPPSSKSPCWSAVTRRVCYRLPGRSPRASLPCLPLLGKPQTPEVLLCITVVLALLQPFPCFSPRCWVLRRTRSLFVFLLLSQQLRKGLRREAAGSDCSQPGRVIELSEWFKVAVRWGLKSESSGLL